MTPCLFRAHLLKIRYAVPTVPSGAISRSVFSGTVTILLSDLLSTGREECNLCTPGKKTSARNGQSCPTVALV